MTAVMRGNELTRTTFRSSRAPSLRLYPESVPVAIGRNVGKHRTCQGEIEVVDAGLAMCQTCGKLWDAALRVVLTPR